MASLNFHVLVIGAGLSGIAFSRFYLDIHPECKLALLEEDTCVGGVWSASRLYNGFWSQSGMRMSGFSDTPLRLPPDAETYHDIFESKYVTSYLETYVDEHVYKSRSLRDRIYFDIKVRSIEKLGNSWRVSGRRSEKEEEETFSGAKLVIATGHTTIPNMPVLPGQSVFQGDILHQKECGKATSRVLGSDSYQNVTILGGGKSAADMVYDSVKAGKKVSWIIRETGEGPAAFAGAAGKGPYRNGPEIAATRILSALSPSCFAPISWWTSMIHGSKYGRSIVAKVWLGADQACSDLAKFQDREGALPGFENMKSSTIIFWCTGPLGMIQHEDFWSTIAGNVSIHRSNIRTMQEKSILLENGSVVLSDVLFCGTGWSQHYPFLSKQQVAEFGFPHDPEEDGKELYQKWTSLLDAADQQVLMQFPALANPPPNLRYPNENTGTRLYNGITPLNDDSIAFVGHILLSNSFRNAEAQAIWTTAYFDKKIELPETEQAEKEIAYMNAFSKRRYPTHGATGAYFHFDLVGYTDKLMRDIGLKSHRKGGWWADLTAPCLASDFKDIKDEYLSKFGP